MTIDKCKIAYPLSTTWIDYPDNESVAVIIYFVGCDHNCYGCHNPDFQHESTALNSIEMNVSDILYLTKNVTQSYHTDKIVFSGGDPLHPNHRSQVRHLLKELNSYNVCIYTGYDVTEVMKMKISGFKFIKTGKYVSSIAQKSYKNDEMLVLSSQNQQLYDSEYRLLTDLGIYKFKGE